MPEQLSDEQLAEWDVMAYRFGKLAQRAMSPTVRAAGEDGLQLILRVRAAERALRDARDGNARLSAAWCDVVQREQRSDNAHDYDMQQLAAERDALRERLAAVDRLCVEWGDEPWPEGRRSIALISFIGHVRDTLSAADPSRSPSLPAEQEQPSE